VIDTLLVFFGGGLGAGARYLGDRWVQSLHRLRFPLGTLAVNLVGCFVIGLVEGGLHRHGLSARDALLLGTGICGGLTTFSTFAVEVVELAHKSSRARSALYLGLSVGLGVALTELGWMLVS
jgi:CrcB protein